MKSPSNMKPAAKWHVPGSMCWPPGRALALVVLAALATALVACSGTPESTPTPSQAGAAQPTATSSHPGAAAPTSISSQANLPALIWGTVAPEEQGFDSAKLADGLLALREDGTHIHSFMIVRNGSVLLDAYFYPYDGKTPHDMASVTKSIMTTLIGIAADQGKLSLDDTMVSFFPDRTISNLDERKTSITVKDLVSMSSGLACTGANTEVLQQEMKTGADWVQYGLNLPVAIEPGTRFQYCGVGSHILSGILQKATGMTSLEFARQNLFGPLGIKDVIWPADPQGNNHGWGDLHLYPSDMAKIGYLWLSKGQWEGKGIVSSNWVEDSIQPLFRADEDDYYGYGWWVGSAPGSPMEYSAEGNGGQTIMIYPDLNLMVVTTGGGFDYGEAGSVVGAALPDKSGTAKALPANPAAVARLNEALATIAQSPDLPKPVPTLPATAGAISGKTFVFPSGGELKTLRLDFDDSAEAKFRLTVTGDVPTRGGAVGLDGVYRISPLQSPNGVPEAFRGRWTDPQTFVIDYDRIGDYEGWKLSLRFEGDASDRVLLEAFSRTGDSIRAQGQLQNQ